MCVLGFGHVGGGAQRLARARSDPRAAGRNGEARPRALASYSLSKKADQIRTFLIGFVPHLIMAGFLDVPLPEAARLRQRGRAPVSDLHHALRGGGQARLPARAARSPARSPAIGLIFLALVPRGALPRLARHGQAPAGRRLPAVPVGDELRLGRSASVSVSGAACRSSTCPKRTPTSSRPSSARSFGFVGVLGLCAAYLRRRFAGVRIALLAEDDYGSFIAFGISTMFGVQALVNLAVAMAILPTKGLTLALRQLRRVVAPRERGGDRHSAQRLAPARPRDARHRSLGEDRCAGGERSRRDLGRGGGRMSATSDRCSSLAGGGTGGHVFPMVAVRRRAARRSGRARRVRRHRARYRSARRPPRGRRARAARTCFPSKGNGRSAPRAADAPRQRCLPRCAANRDPSGAESRARGGRLRRPAPWASWPRALAACRSRILEPNSVLGLSNRWLVPFARRAYRRVPGPARRCRRARGAC